MLVDSHCHPTDHPELRETAAGSALRMCIMSTRLDDLDLVAEWAAAMAPRVTPAFGLHPWYSHWLSTMPGCSKLAHYQSILDPPPQTEADVRGLPDPVPLQEFLARLRLLLLAAPHAVLGEVGLDKPFRVKLGDTLLPHRVRMEHQRAVLRAQLQIADELRRSVSLHGVQAAQPLFEEVRAFGRLRAVCLHSYGGSPEFYRDSWRKLRVPIYVSIAVLINGRMPAAKLERLLAVLDERLVLTESDMNRAGDEQTELVRQSLALFADRFGWADAEARIEENYSRFLNG